MGVSSMTMPSMTLRLKLSCTRSESEPHRSRKASRESRSTCEMRGDVGRYGEMRGDVGRCQVEEASRERGSTLHAPTATTLAWRTASCALSSRHDSPKTAP